MDVRTLTSTSEPGHAELLLLLGAHDSLGAALGDWAATCPDAKVAGELPRVIVQDEYSHDVVVRWGKRQHVVYATT